MKASSKHRIFQTSKLHGGYRLRMQGLSQLAVSHN
ncbi:hypothetical protein T01_3729 [Trichinella spiralis]|uniref:Uncharacterized protein n=1 Tax=Trichinella spiralis TaxID=6334 RepID=A0A0V1A106_TRISP|nr:hypothetical protein T01_3729 [Trichinella spiralis]